MFKIYPGGELSWRTMLEMMLWSKLKKKKHIYCQCLSYFMCNISYTKLLLLFSHIFMILLTHLWWIEEGGSCIFLSFLWSASIFSIHGCEWGVPGITNIRETPLSVPHIMGLSVHQHLLCVGQTGLRLKTMAALCSKHRKHFGFSIR